MPSTDTRMMSFTFLAEINLLHLIVSELTSTWYSEIQTLMILYFIHIWQLQTKFISVPDMLNYAPVSDSVTFIQYTGSTQARVNKAKLLDAMGTFFARSNRPVNEKQNPIEVVRSCTACRESEMVLKQKQNGEFMVGCQSYPQCRNVVWLPGPVSEASVTNQACRICTPGSAYKIQFKFRRRDIPPNFDADHLGY